MREFAKSETLQQTGYFTVADLRAALSGIPDGVWVCIDPCAGGPMHDIFVEPNASEPFVTLINHA